jgi:hypothetical protein
MSEPSPDVDSLSHMMRDLNRPIAVSVMSREGIHQVHRPCVMTVTGPWYNHIPIVRNLDTEPEPPSMEVLALLAVSNVEITVQVFGGNKMRVGRLVIDAPDQPCNPTLKIFMDWAEVDDWFLLIQAATGGRAVQA